MLKSKLLLLVGWFAASLILGIGCKQAKYEFKKKNAQENPGPENPIDDPNKNAPATETLPANEFKGDSNFYMKGTPGTGKIGENIVFTGTCGDNADEELTWQFGDGQSSTGNSVTHHFVASRKYVIDATCKDKDGNERRGSIIVFIDSNLNGNGDPNQNNPGQGPNQSNPGQQTL